MSWRQLQSVRAAASLRCGRMSRHSQLEDDRAAQPHYASGWGLPQGAVASDRPPPSCRRAGQAPQGAAGRRRIASLADASAVRRARSAGGGRACATEGKIELVGGDFALYIEGHIHLKPILRRFGVPNSFGVLAQPRNT